MNVADELTPFFLGKEGLDTAVARAADLFLQLYESGTFVCDVCGETIYPKVLVNCHGIFVESTKSEIRGGLGNYVLKKNVCESCEQEMRSGIGGDIVWRNRKSQI